MNNGITPPFLYGNFISPLTRFDYNDDIVINGQFFSTNQILFRSNGNTTVNPVGVCYLKGTQILTENGYKKIEDLNVGDKVVTKGQIFANAYTNVDEEFSLEPIVMIGNYRAPNLTDKSFPICIKANALGENMPFEDLYVSPGHRILLDGKLVLATDLINGETIFQDRSFLEIDYYHLELKDHHSIVANGILSESYLDYNTRIVFSSTKQTPLLENTEVNVAANAIMV